VQWTEKPRDVLALLEKPFLIDGMLEIIEQVAESAEAGGPGAPLH